MFTLVFSLENINEPRLARLYHEVSYPVANGAVQSWEDMHHVWRHTFEDRLGIDPTECKILLTDPPLNPKKNRERMVSTMFETWGFQAGPATRSRFTST